MRGAPPAGSLAVLTYHSISSAGGPTSIPLSTFRMQMDALAERGFASLGCADFVVWQQGGARDGRSVLITFDDAFADFAEAAHPVLRAHGFSALVFVPTGRVGGHEAWCGAHPAPRALLDWDTIRALATEGVEFGGHGVSHEDLTRLAPEARRHEIDDCARALAERLGAAPTSFAAPYGRVDETVRADIARTYAVAFGTGLEHATRASDRYDVPRIEMHYFRQARRWGAFLDGSGAYLAVRRALRTAREHGTRVLGRRGGA